MRRFIIPLVFIVLCGLFFIACEMKVGETPEGTAPIVVSAAELFKMMGDGMAAYRLFEGTTEMQEGKSPHGAYVTILVNGVAARSIEEKAGSFDEGSLIVKKNYDQDKKFTAYTVMYKVKGYDPEHGDWYWAKFTEDGTTDLEGEAVKALFQEKGEGCIACHTQVKDKDWVFTEVPK
jgi:hypothetical protein